MNRAKMALVTLAAAAAVPIAMAAPASARTSSGCTVKPLKPVFAGFNSSGVKLLNHPISVSCLSNRTVRIEQRLYEQDVPPDPDDLIGVRWFRTSGVRTLSSVWTLVNTEPGNEEVYQKVCFWVISHGVTSPGTCEKSSVVSIPN